MLAQRFVYYSLWLLVKLSLRLFYRSFTTQGNEFRDIRGPFIVVSNHPNTLMDGLIVAALMKERLMFLGKSTLFKNPKAAAVLRFFGFIPVYRKEDVQPGETVSSNDDSFRQAYEQLEKGGGFLVFPEGTSLVGRRLLEIKTGTARIGLGYEAKHDFQGGLQILPISINYSSSTHFRSRVHVILNEPIQVGNFKNQHEEDPKEAVRELTDEISYGLAEGLVILEDPKQERMFQQAVRILRKNRKRDKANSKERFEKEKRLAAGLRTLREEKPERYQDLQDQLEQWFALLDRLGLKQSFFGEAMRKVHPALLAFITGFLLVLGAPFALLGILSAYLPYRICAWLPPRIASDIEYRAPLMLLLGLILLPIFFAGFAVTFWAFSHAHISAWWSLAFFFSLPICGWIALEWADGWDRLFALLRMSWLQGRRGNIAKRLENRRKSLQEALLGLMA